MSLLVNLFLSRIRLPRDVHRHAFRKYPDRIAIQMAEGKAITYGLLQRRSAALVRALRSAGLKKGDVLFAQMPSCPEMFEIRIAALELGLVLTGLHALHDPAFLAHSAGRAKPKLFIHDPACMPGADAAFARCRPGAPIWALGPDGEYEAQLQRHPSGAAPAVRERIAPEDPMLLGFTSGTTGTPKGLISSHGAAVASLKLVIRNINIRPDRKARNIALSAIPLAGAGSGLILPTMLSGGTLVVMEPYSPERLVETIERYQVSRLFVTPSQLIDMLDLPPEQIARLSSVNHIIYGTSPMPAAKLEEAITLFGPILQQGYGQAEVLPPVSLLRPEEHVLEGAPAPRALLRSCGKVVKGVKLRIRGGDGSLLGPCSTGAIEVLTPTRMQTYLDPARNRGVILEDGWFATGDHGYLDEAGYLHVIDRADDIIQTRQGPLYPRLVEEEAHDYPALKECCLVEIEGRRVLLASLRAQLRDEDTVDFATGILAHLKGRLPKSFQPDEVRIVPEVPRSFLHKITRKHVRQQMQDPTIQASMKANLA